MKIGREIYGGAGDMNVPHLLGKRGFTLVELIIVIAILAILAGVAVPYYQDYVFDARMNAIKANMATLRRALEDFRGDHGRGPYRERVWYSGGETEDCTFTGSGNELVAGNAPSADAYLNNGIKFRRNKYLNNYPLLEDPSTGEMLAIQFSQVSANLYYFDDGATPHVDVLDVDGDPQFIDLNGNGGYDSGIDTIVFGTDAQLSAGALVDIRPGDIASLWVIDSKGNMY